MMSTTPEMSIVLTAGVQRERGAKALASLLTQEGVERTEIFVIDTALDRFPPLTHSDHPLVTVVPMSDDMHIGQLRTYGALISKATYIGYLEDHCIALPGWLKFTLESLQAGGWSAVATGLALATDGPSLGSLVAYLSFRRWLEPAESHAETLLPGHNTAYRRDTLLSIGPGLSDLMLSEPIVQDHLQQKGATLLLDARSRYIHCNEDTIRGIGTNYFVWNMFYGRQRVDGKRLLHPIRLLRIATIPLVPFVRFVKSVVTLRNRGVLEQYTKYLPIALLFHLVESLGLLAGYLGAGTDFESFLTYSELGAVREWPDKRYVTFASLDEESSR